MTSPLSRSPSLPWIVHAYTQSDRNWRDLTANQSPSLAPAQGSACHASRGIAAAPCPLQPKEDTSDLRRVAQGRLRCWRFLHAASAMFPSNGYMAEAAGKNLQHRKSTRLNSS